MTLIMLLSACSNTGRVQLEPLGSTIRILRPQPGQRIRPGVPIEVEGQVSPSPEGLYPSKVILDLACDRAGRDSLAGQVVDLAPSDGGKPPGFRARFAAPARKGRLYLRARGPGEAGRGARGTVIIAIEIRS